MSVGLIALLDDVAAIAKVAAASLDDVAGQAAQAGAKAAGVVIDDAAVTPRYVMGFAADRELPIVRKIALGSLKNKLLFLLPAALVLNAFAPSAITPLLMIGGAFLCYEGAEKLYHAIAPHDAEAHEAKLAIDPADAAVLERQKVNGAIKTDFILSAEIMAITLGAIPEAGFWRAFTVLSVVGVAITVLVYGAVALIVKADDLGVRLARSANGAARVLGRALVTGMPYFLQGLSYLGMAAMVWVGGGIVVHGLEVFGLPLIGHVIHDAAAAAGAASPILGGLVEWLVSAFGSGVIGLALGAALIPIVSNVVAPAWKGLHMLFARTARPRA